MMELDRDDCQSDESTVEDVDDATYSLGDLSCGDVQLWATDLEVTSAVLANLISYLHATAAAAIRKASIAPSKAAEAIPEPVIDNLSHLAEKYHGGWCLVAVRRELEGARCRNDNLLQLIPLFGKDAVTSLQPCLENFGAILQTSEHQALPRNDQPLRDHGYAAPIAATQHEEQKHTFVLVPAACSLFHQLNLITHSQFPSMLNTHKQHAVSAMQEHLEANLLIRQLFNDIVQDKNRSYDFLKLVIRYFMKSKQKQLLKQYGLSPANQSIALRTGLRQHEKKKKRLLRPHQLKASCGRNCG
eukprot:scpid23683/ scgid3934/ 